ncbi:MAG TPA: chloride channel protein [Candidatus Acidoferrum sp.]|nr:chloride channel protein [Candidatus Acidoferrum sp.]
MSSPSKPTPQRPIYTLAYWRQRLSAREDQTFLALTIVIGALAGLAVVAFILLTERLGARLFPPNVSVLRRMLAPAIGSLVIGYVLVRFFPDARGNGVTQTRAAFYSSDARITLHAVVGKFLCTSATLASGIPLGPEGPSIAVGAGIASVLGRKIGLSTEKVRSLIPVGAAAAIAAAFNTPIAAVIFSLEEIVGDLHAPVLGSVVLASATAWMVLRLSLGNEPLFHVPQYALVDPLEFAIYAVLGVAAGVVSGVFIRLQLAIRAQFRRLPARTAWAQPLAGGVVVGLVGYFVPQILGVGYDHVSALLNGEMAIRLAALLVVLKLITVVASSGTGNAGGIFAPVLFIGAMLGGAIGGVAHIILPHHTASPGAYALVGMGALFAGIIRTPMTSVVLVFEITRDYAIIVPLMIANLVSYFISRKVTRESLYEGLTRQEGFHLPSSGDHSREDARRVFQILRPPEDSLPAAMTVAEASSAIGSSRARSWLVMDQNGVRGVLSTAHLRNFLADRQSDITLGDLFESPVFPHLHRDHSFDLALERMGHSGLDQLPVVSRFNVRELLGVVRLQDILAAYHVVPAEADKAVE